MGLVLLATHVDLQRTVAIKIVRSELARNDEIVERRVMQLSIEQQAIEYVTDTLQSWFKNWEEELSYQLLTEVEQEEYFFEFLIDALMRGDAVMRGQFYMTGIQAGWLLRNEARARENLNPIDGLDEPLQPLNMGPAGAEPPAPAADPRDDEDEEQRTSGRTRRLEEAAAARGEEGSLRVATLHKRNLH
jgi:hypothetical protein